jgi:hypothetical protein
VPAIAPIVIADGKSTPVNHTFDPVTTNGSRGDLANRAASIPRGFEKLSLEVRQAGSSTGSHALRGEMVLPTVAAVDGQDNVVRENKFSFTFNFSQLSTAQDRKDAITLAKNLLANAILIAMAEKIEPLY